MERPPGRSFFWAMIDSSASRSLLTALRALFEPVAERQGCVVIAIELVGGLAGRRILRVSVDRPFIPGEPYKGATIEDCTRISRGASPALDTSDLIAEAFDLELSTPGMERPVQRDVDFAYFAGCDIRIKLYGMDGRKRIKARLLGAAEGVVRVLADDGERDIPLADIERANLVLDFEQYARLGRGLHPIAEGDTP